MHRGIEIVLNETLTHEDGILVVVALPGHVGDQHVLTQGDLTALTGRAIGEHLASDHLVAQGHDRAVVEAGVLVGALVLLEVVVVIHPGLVANDDGRGIHIGHGAVHRGDRHHARVPGHLGFQTRTHQGPLGPQQGHGLTLHVRAHQGPVGIVVLQEGDQGGSHRDHLNG